MQLLTAIAALVANVLFLVGVVVWLSRRFESLRQMGVDWQGAPERRDPTGTIIDPARPGVQGRLVRLEVAQAEAGVKLAAINKELHPNSGTSFHDVVLGDIAKLQAAVTELQARAAQAPKESTLEAA